MLLLGGGLLVWYYTGAFTRQTRARISAQAGTIRKARTEMALPPLDLFSTLKGSAADPEAAKTQAGMLRPPAALPQSAAAPGVTTSFAGEASPPSGGRSDPEWAAERLAPHQRVYSGSRLRKSADDRLLSGSAFARESGLRAERADALPAVGVGAAATSAPSIDADSGGSLLGGDSGEIAPWLNASPPASVRARVLPTKRFLLPKGAFIDCTLETAIDSTLPGMTTCVTATDTFSADGSVVLLERGTKLIGETRGRVQQGIARVFVLWMEARTPEGIVVPLDSPGTDELGRSGLSGKISRHFWERFGAAILISTLDGGVQAAVQSAGRGGGPIIYNPSSTETVITDILKGTVNIPPTIKKSNGDRIEVFVARDVDFRTVYELRPIDTKR
jgi:type IV secretion system protein VirB10